ncbi:unnamed protein product [Moneuplotes crassus]|uniref:Uncharacterized protein n=1 Tax=Euplotes crassus TaxID=5936 RepID=A0AAD1X887_EUPCR|nr:unnamed protein product [Moneuplotes crassus]
MKFLNTIFKEILVFLEFRDITGSQLAFVNKQFYHNIVEDNTLIRRILMNYLVIITDYEKEEEYQRAILLDLHERRCLAENAKEEFEEVKFSKYYDSPAKELAPLFNKFSRKYDKKQLVCTWRTTAGYETEVNEIVRIFMDDRSIYYSAEQGYFPNGVYCVTGIACEQNFEDHVVARKLLRNVQELDHIFGYEVEEENPIWIESSEFNVGEVQDRELFPESLRSRDPKILNYWLRNRLAFSIWKTGMVDEDQESSQNSTGLQNHKIIKFDVSIHQALHREQLLCWNRFRVLKCKYGSCPVSAFAVLSHDFPLKPENHPLAILLKNLYNKEIRPNITRESCIDEQGEMLSKLLKKLSANGIIPDVANTSDNMFELNVKYYYNKFDGQMGDYQQHNEALRDSISRVTGVDTLPLELYDKLGSMYDYYRFRLNSIVFGLKCDEIYNFHLKQLITGRYVSILALDINNIDNDPNANVDFGGVQFYGNMIPSPLTVDK